MKLQGVAGGFPHFTLQESRYVWVMFTARVPSSPQPPQPMPNIRWGKTWLPGHTQHQPQPLRKPLPIPQAPIPIPHPVFKSALQ